MKVSGAQSWCGHFGEKKNSLLLAGIETRFVGCPACSTVTTFTLHYWFHAKEGGNTFIM
jgi:hypothetical protein